MGERCKKCGRLQSIEGHCSVCDSTSTEFVEIHNTEEATPKTDFLTGSMKGYSEEKHSYQQGWVCPKCGSVYSPYTSECHRCSTPYKLECTY